jgi:hypothetical protein
MAAKESAPTTARTADAMMLSELMSVLVKIPPMRSMSTCHARKSVTSTLDSSRPFSAQVGAGIIEESFMQRNKQDVKKGSKIPLMI